MTKILAENLSNKAVMGTDGKQLGTLYNITVDLATGSLANLVVTPDQETSFDADFQVDEEGRYHVSVSRVQAVQDYIVIQR